LSKILLIGFFMATGRQAIGRPAGVKRRGGWQKELAQSIPSV
jgi:hypothetical protein